MLLFPIILLLLIFIFLITVYCIMEYIFESFTVMKIMKNLNWKRYDLAFLPGYNKYLLAKSISSKKLGVFSCLSNFLFLGTMLSNILIKKQLDFNYLLVIFLCSSFIGFIVNTIIAHKIFKKCIPQYEVLLTLFCILSLGFLRPIFLFCIRNKFLSIETIR